MPLKSLNSLKSLKNHRANQHVKELKKKNLKSNRLRGYCKLPAFKRAVNKSNRQIIEVE